MKNQLLTLDEENLKQFAITDEDILVSSKTHPSIESLKQSKEKKGLLEHFGAIPLHQIEEVKFNAKDELLVISYVNEKGKSKRESFKFEKKAQRKQVAEYLGETLNLRFEEEEESKTKPLALNALSVLLAVVVTVGLRFAAIDAQQGVEYNPTGRNRGMAKLIHELAGMLGPLWITVLGVLVAGFLIYRTYKRYQEPAKVSVYRK